jgi:hypothetical protein
MAHVLGAPKDAVAGRRPNVRIAARLAPGPDHVAGGHVIGDFDEPNRPHHMATPVLLQLAADRVVRLRERVERGDIGPRGRISQGVERPVETLKVDDRVQWPIFLCLREGGGRILRMGDASHAAQKGQQQ